MTARTFALIAGIVYIAVGLLGFIPAANPVPAGSGPHPDLAITTLYGHQLGLFPINVLHNIVHLAIGMWGLAASRSSSGARGFARALAIIYTLLAIMGLPFMPGILKTTFGLIPLYGADTLLHIATAAIAAYFGFVAPAERASAVDASRMR